MFHQNNHAYSSPVCEMWAVVFTFIVKDTISAIPNIHTRSTIEKKLHIARGKCMVICVCVSPDGAEMMLDLGLPASLIGGIVLPLLGAVPDSAMIIASGVGKSRDQANKEIAVGMGYVMLSSVYTWQITVQLVMTYSHKDNLLCSMEFLHSTYVVYNRNEMCVCPYYIR